MHFKPETKEDLFLLGNLHIVARAIHIFAEYPIADYLMEKKRCCKDIAAHFNFDENAIRKLLRVLAVFNVVKEEENDQFSLTELGKYLCHEHPQILKDRLFWDETRWNSFGKLDETLKTGCSSFSSLYGEDYFSYLSKYPKKQHAFDQHMRAVSEDENQILANEIPLGPHAHVMDIGGGKGGLIEAILNKHDSVKGILFDLPETIESVEMSLKKKYGDKIECTRGSFFEEIEGACDVAILKRVLHDWDDDDCVHILKNVKKTLKPNGKIYIIETVLQGKQDSSLTRMFDLFLLTVFGGAERSLEQYQNLISKSGCTFSRLIETSSSKNILVVSISK